MKKNRKTIVIILTLASIALAGCSKDERVKVSETVGEEVKATTSKSIDNHITDQPVPVAVETNAAVEPDSQSRSYYLQINEETPFVPCLQLFDNGEFSFGFDVLSSYLSYGTYEVKDGKLTAVTDDGLYHYVFKEENGQYHFIQKESSEIYITDSRMGAEVKDGAVFALRESETEEQEKIAAVVKEIEDDYLLVSSRTDEMPGVYYVYFGDLDVSRIEGGDEIQIVWNGTITEDNKIFADNLEIP